MTWFWPNKKSDPSQVLILLNLFQASWNTKQNKSIAVCKHLDQTGKLSTCDHHSWDKYIEEHYDRKLWTITISSIRIWNRKRPGLRITIQVLHHPESKHLIISYCSIYPFNQSYQWELYLQCKAGNTKNIYDPNYVEQDVEFNFFLNSKAGMIDFLFFKQQIWISLVAADVLWKTNDIKWGECHECTGLNKIIYFKGKYDIDKPLTWIKCNKDFKGFYVTDYSSEIFENITMVLKYKPEVCFSLVKLND